MKSHETLTEENKHLREIYVEQSLKDAEKILTLEDENNLLATQCMLHEAIQGKLKKRIAHLEAQVDRLMIEYCPDEMTQEQWDNWAKHQQRVDLGTKLKLDNAN